MFPLAASGLSSVRIGDVRKASELASRTLRCYAEGRDPEWEAICLDLDIAVQGGSFEAVFAALGEAISLYLDTVADLPPHARYSLLDRPVPLSVRLRFLTRALRELCGPSGGGRQRHEFTMAVSA